MYNIAFSAILTIIISTIFAIDAYYKGNVDSLSDAFIFIKIMAIIYVIFTIVDIIYNKIEEFINEKG